MKISGILQGLPLVDILEKQSEQSENKLVKDVIKNTLGKLHRVSGWYFTANS